MFLNSKPPSHITLEEKRRHSLWLEYIWAYLLPSILRFFSQLSIRRRSPKQVWGVLEELSRRIRKCKFFIPLEQVFVVFLKSDYDTPYVVQVAPQCVHEVPTTCCEVFPCVPSISFWRCWQQASVVFVARFQKMAVKASEAVALSS